MAIILNKNRTRRVKSILMGALFFLSVQICSGSPSVPMDSINRFDTLTSVTKYHIARDHDSDSLHITDTLYYLPVDSIKPAADSKIKSIRPKRIPSPQRATVLSAVLPGLGQAYNNKYWKIPIIYSASYGLYYIYNFQNDIYLKYKKKYEEEVGKGAWADQDDIDIYTNYFEEARKWRDYCIIFMGVLYLANIVDAMADAYFLQYDISDDLTVQVNPEVIPEPFIASGSFSYGLRLYINF